MSGQLLKAWQSFPSTLEAAVEAWHSGAGEGLELHEFLGLSWDEYKILTGPKEAEVSEIQRIRIQHDRMCAPCRYAKVPCSLSVLLEVVEALSQPELIAVVSGWPQLSSAERSGLVHFVNTIVEQRT